MAACRAARLEVNTAQVGILADQVVGNGDGGRPSAVGGDGDAVALGRARVGHGWIADGIARDRALQRGRVGRASGQADTNGRAHGADESVVRYVELGMGGVTWV